MDIPEINMEYELYLDFTRVIPKGSNAAEVLDAGCMLIADALTKVKKFCKENNEDFDKQEWLCTINKTIDQLMEDFK